MGCIAPHIECKLQSYNKIQYLLIHYRIIEIYSNFQRSIHRIASMSTCHIQKQCILRVIFIGCLLLMIVNDMVVNPPETLDHSLLLRRILPTGNGSRKPV
uniref:AC5 protein n=1 Tax=Begomovirus alternantherae TaxID=337826 RepID=A0A224AVL2_9GEMI|nr:AC5 protein [Alternanthera yellow vein virus]